MRKVLWIDQDKNIKITQVGSKVVKNILNFIILLLIVSVVSVLLGIELGEGIQKGKEGLKESQCTIYTLFDKEVTK